MRLLVTWLKDREKSTDFFVFFSEEKEEWTQIVFTSPPSTPCSRPFLNSEWCKIIEFCLSFVHFSITLFLSPTWNDVSFPRQLKPLKKLKIKQLTLEIIPNYWTTLSLLNFQTKTLPLLIENLCIFFYEFWIFIWFIYFPIWFFFHVPLLGSSLSVTPIFFSELSFISFRSIFFSFIYRYFFFLFENTFVHVKHKHTIRFTQTRNVRPDVLDRTEILAKVYLIAGVRRGRDVRMRIFSRYIPYY